ncbi:MAG: hypothetical protein RIQ60_2387 [Pseudomonadota bacterium]
MFKKLMDKAKEISEKAELGTKFQTTLETTRQKAAEHYEASKIMATELLDENKQKVETAFATHWPRIESELLQRLVGVAEDKLLDPSTVESAFDKSYELLPGPVRLLLSRKIFIDYCMSHRGPLVEKIHRYKVNNWAALGYSSAEQASSSSPLRLEHASETGAPANTQAPPLALNNDTKVCPMCAESVKAAALICRYCSHRFAEPSS